jgi:hypothetical protein
MAKAKLQTQATDASVDDFIAAVVDPQRRSDAEKVLAMYKRVTGEQPKMWGPAIIGFGNSKLKYPDGREIDWMKAAFSPRKQNMTLYVICDSPRQPALLAKLGKHSTSVACLYIKKLSDVDEKVLEAIVKDSFNYVAKRRESV